MNYFKLAGAAVVSVLAFGTPALANVSFTSGQLDSGLRYILVSGPFEAQDNLSRFSYLVSTTKPNFVTFNSPGGSVYKAMELGKLIRQFNLATVEIKSQNCESACALAFLGGVLRFADAGAIGVHRSSFADGNALGGNVAAAAIQQATADIMAYIKSMGADPSLLEIAFSYGSNDMRYLSSSEMAQYHVTTAAPQSPTPSIIQPAAPSNPPLTASLPQPSTPQASAPQPLPVPRSGVVRHRKGFVFLRAASDKDSPEIAKLENGYRLQILGDSNRWYEVRAGNQVGFLHETWVKVDQYEPTRFNRRFIQIASYNNWPDVELFLKYETLPVSVHLASNGWYAITLADAFDKKHGFEVLKQLKSKHLIADDSYVTYGNTYVEKVK